MDDSELYLQQVSSQTKKSQMSSDEFCQQAEQRISSMNSDPLLSRLSLSEQLEFSHICSYFQLADDRNKRNFGMSTFIKHLNLIHRFVVRDDGGDALRGLVCGILFGNGFLLVNTEKLKRLTKRSKSCVNGCFQKLGFNVFRETQDLNGFFSKLFPNIDPSLLNSRHWCIRKASDEAPICFIASIPLDISVKCGFPSETYQMMTYPNYHPLSRQQNNLTNTNNNLNVGSFSPPNSSLFNDQTNIQMNLSVNGYTKDLPVSNATDKQQNSFQFQQQTSQSSKPLDKLYQKQQCFYLNYSSDNLDTSSEPETRTFFFTDIKSLLNR